ncbi:MAG TPA: histidinol-phosphatase [Acidobacteriota bacterium]|nr:histidinol-phosphatase [Acidobacteriota bacterium]
MAANWKVSLHGGHSGEYCEHAKGTLREMVEAAVGAGYHVFGVSEHAPRSQQRFLYASEKEKGYDVERLAREFDTYAAEMRALQEEFAADLVLLRGFESESVPADSYAGEMNELRRRYNFDFVVGSVHHVEEVSIDGPKEDFEKAVEACGGLEDLILRYYEQVAQMVESIKPDVVAHLDLPRLNAPADDAALNSPKVRRRADQTLDVIRSHQSILDVNTAALRKGLPAPYPDGWLVRAAQGMRIPFCFGDDSHGPQQVGQGLEEARRHLLEHGVDHVVNLTLRHGTVVRERRMLG